MAGELDEKRNEKKQEQIAELNEQLGSELQMWELGGIDPENISINAYLLDQWLFALRDWLIELGIIDEQDFLIFYKTRLLENLKEMRPKVMAHVERIKREMDKPGIVGPGGERLN